MQGYCNCYSKLFKSCHHSQTFEFLLQFSLYFGAEDELFYSSWKDCLCDVCDAIVLVLFPGGRSREMLLPEHQLLVEDDTQYLWQHNVYQALKKWKFCFQIWTHQNMFCLCAVLRNGEEWIISTTILLWTSSIFVRCLSSIVSSV